VQSASHEGLLHCFVAFWHPWCCIGAFHRCFRALCEYNSPIVSPLKAMKKSTPHSSPATPIDSALRRQLDVLFHSLGLSESGEGNIHRNHFVA